MSRKVEKMKKQLLEVLSGYWFCEKSIFLDHRNSNLFVSVSLIEALKDFKLTTCLLKGLFRPMPRSPRY